MTGTKKIIAQDADPLPQEIADFQKYAFIPGKIKPQGGFGIEGVGSVLRETEIVRHGIFIGTRGIRNLDPQRIGY